MSKASQASSEVNKKGTGVNQTTLEGAVADNPSFQITTVKLDGTDYIPLARSATLSIQWRDLYQRN